MIRAVFGGSFDPVHRGHLRVAEAVLVEGLADVVHVVPAWLSPHKSSSSASPADRLAMVRLVFGDLENTRVETLEIEGGKPAYTVDTLAALRALYDADAWRLVMGADQLAAYRSWREPDRILRLAEPILLARQTGDLAAACAEAELDPAECRLLPGFDERVSATGIRANLARGEDPGFLLDPRVEAYIRERGLYGT